MAMRHPHNMRLTQSQLMSAQAIASAQAAQAAQAMANQAQRASTPTQV